MLHRPTVSAVAVMLCVSLEFAAVAAHHQQPQQTGGRQEGAEWLKFSPEGAAFSVLLPGAPTGKSRDDDSGMKVHAYSLKTGSTEYQVVWFDKVPDSMLTLDSLYDRGLTGILSSALHAGDKYLVATHKEDVTLAGCLGLESKMESGSDVIEAKGFITGHEFVALAILHRKDPPSSADAKRFLESLSLPEVLAVIFPGENETKLVDVGPGRSPEGGTRPLPLNRPRPDYTEQARNHGVQGAIRIRALVGTDGLVKDVRFTSHLPYGLDERAAKAVREMRFKPATVGGQSVSAWVFIEVEFQLRKKR